MAGLNYNLQLGELIVCPQPAVIATVLGSCVSVTLFSRSHSLGGMIHYALPHAPQEVANDEAFRYGEIAIASLVEEFRALTGEKLSRLEAKVTGGAEEDGGSRTLKVGRANCEVAFQLLEKYGIPVTGQSVGGTTGRKLLFHTATGRLQVCLLNSVRLDQVLAIGASTGGTQALTRVLRALPESIPPTVIVQHIHPDYSGPFAQRLNELCPFEVKEAADGDELRPSRVLIAPGGKQMKIHKRGGTVIARLTDDPPRNRHKPSVDYLFESVATVAGPQAVGVILTGMGADGASGLLKMRERGASTIGQDEKSSVVFGMPKVAYESGAVEKVAPLQEIPELILEALRKRRK